LDGFAYDAMCIKAHREANELTIYNEEMWYSDGHSRDTRRLTRE